MMSRTKCPTCEHIQTVRSKENKVFMTCKKCYTAFSAERMGHKYKPETKKRKRKK